MLGSAGLCLVRTLRVLAEYPVSTLQMMLGSAGLCLASLLTTGADFGVKMFAVNDSEGTQE